MSDEVGPPLEALTRRLAECPAEFLAEPRHGSRGVIDVAAIVADHFRAMGTAVPDLAPFAAKGSATILRRLQLTAISVWLMHDEGLLQRPELAPPMHRFLAEVGSPGTELEFAL